MIYRIAIIIPRIILFSLVIAGCKGGGGGSAYIGGGGNSAGWVTINSPTTEPTTSTNCNSISLGGEAFISPTEWRCCSGSAADTGVSVAWSNVTTGQSGTAFHWVDICYFITAPYLCNHTWSATVPLVVGDNQIMISASDAAGVSAQDSIAVSKPALTYSIGGKVYSTLGLGLWNSGLSGFKLTLTDGVQNPYVFTGKNGNYRFSCILNGSYTITPSSTINFAFTPTTSTVTVNDADVTNIDFVTEAYFISGKVTYASGTGISGVQISLAGTNTTATYGTDANGDYVFAVPNGSYTVTPSYCSSLFFYCQSFMPAVRNVTVNSADVAGQDFVEQ